MIRHVVRVGAVTGRTKQHNHSDIAVNIAGIAATGCLPLRRAAGAGVAQHQTISTINGYLQAAITPSARTRTRAMLAQARPAVSPRRVSRAHVMWVQTVVSAPKWGHVIGVQVWAAVSPRTPVMPPRVQTAESAPRQRHAIRALGSQSATGSKSVTGWVRSVTG